LAETAAVCAPLLGQLIVNHDPAVLTGSEKLTTMFDATPTFVAPSAGAVDATVGAGSDVPRGAGAPAAKSAELSFVSCAPPFLRCADVVFVSVGAAAVSEQLTVP
jgi:hypothetical protein